MPRHSSPSAELEWQMQCIPLSRWCERCMCTFSTLSNRRRHQNQRATPCSPSNKVTPRQVQDEASGHFHFHTREECLEHDRDCKQEEYWRFLSELAPIPCASLINMLIRTLCISTEDCKQQCSRLYQRAKTLRHGGKTPTSTKLEHQCHKWAVVLREVKTNWSEDKLQEYARLLAARHSVGDSNVPTWVHGVYQAMDV
jgi:hypothetical protein